MRAAVNELESFKKSDCDFSVGNVHQPGRYIRPPKAREIPERMLKYSFAEKLAADIVPETGMRVFVILNGKFIAGDFFEAWMVAHNIVAKRMVVSTLSLSEANVDSLENLLVGGFVDRLDLVVSDYFYSHERRNLVPYIYKKLDIEDRFQFAAAGTHCKVCLIETIGGHKLTVHGSANLRSSGNLEHICIEECPALHDFNIEVQDRIIEKYKTIRKAERHEALWKTITNDLKNGIWKQGQEGKKGWKQKDGSKQAQPTRTSTFDSNWQNARCAVLIRI